MTILVIGLVLFFAAHSVSIINVAWRDRIVERIGEWPWKGIYSLVAIAGFVLIVRGYALARQDPIFLYFAPARLEYLALVLMIFVFPLFLAAYLPGGIKTSVEHPMLTATAIWAFAHLLTNGTLADVALFGSFLVWAVADRMSLKRRPQRSVLTAPAARINDAIAIAAGLVICGLFIVWLHESWFGVSVLG